MLSNIAQTCFPVEYAARLPEVAAAKLEMKLEMPVFFYNQRQYPGYELQLHLFEPRYRLMMQRVTESNRCFAYLPNFVDYQAKEGDVGLIAELDECEFMHDGRCNIKATLKKRFSVVEHWVEDGTQNLTYVKVKYVHDEDKETESEKNDLIKAQDECGSFLDALYATNFGQQLRHIPIKTQIGEEPSKNNAETHSFWIARFIALFVQTSSAVEQSIIAETDTTKRYKILNDLLKMVTTRIQEKESEEATKEAKSKVGDENENEAEAESVEMAEQQSEEETNSEENLEDGLYDSAESDPEDADPPRSGNGNDIGTGIDTTTPTSECEPAAEGARPGPAGQLARGQ